MQSTQPAKYADHLDASARQQPTKITGVECIVSREEIKLRLYMYVNLRCVEKMRFQNLLWFMPHTRFIAAIGSAKKVIMTSQQMAHQALSCDEWARNCSA